MPIGLKNSFKSNFQVYDMYRKHSLDLVKCSEKIDVTEIDPVFEILSYM